MFQPFPKFWETKADKTNAEKKQDLHMITHVDPNKMWK